MLEELPDDSSLEDIQYPLYVLQEVKRGIERADAQCVLPHAEAKRRLDKWLGV